MKFAEGKWVYVVIALVTFAVYWPVHKYDFVIFDDGLYVTQNPHVQAGLTAASIRWAFTHQYASFWHPLTMLSHMLDCELFGLNPEGHHLTNLVLHTANTLLLFWVLKSMTGALWRSAFVAALFALHPLHVESVAWVAERKDVLSSLFWLLTTAAYLRYVRNGGAKWYSVTLLLFALGLMAKPMLITLPFVLLLLDYWPLNRLTRYTIYEKLPFFGLSAASSIITFFAQRSAGAVASVALLPLSVRITNAFVSYLRYIEKTIWPADLAVFYPYSGKLSFWFALTSVLVLSVVTNLVIRLAPKHRYLPVGWFWYLGTLVPVIGLVKVGSFAMADRYTYLPLIGIFIIVAWGVSELSDRLKYQKLILGFAAGIVLAALLVCTRIQMGYWHNSITLFEHTLAVTADNNVTHSNLGIALLQNGRLDEAIDHFQQALRLKLGPDSVDVVYCYLGLALARQNKFGEAIDQYQQALKIKPDSATVHNNLGVALQAIGNLDEAIVHYRLALKDMPDSVETNNNLAWILATYPDQKLRDAGQAIVFAERAAELTKYKDPAVLKTLMTAYTAAGKKEHAEQIRIKIEEMSGWRQTLDFKN